MADQAVVSARKGIGEHCPEASIFATSRITPSRRERRALFRGKRG